MAEPTLFQNGAVFFATSTGSVASAQLNGVKSVTAPFTNAELEDAVMGDVLQAKYPGLQDRPISITCRQDFTTSATQGVDKLVYTRQENRTAFRVKLRPVNAAVSSTNPSYLFTRMRIFGSTPITGAHGELLGNTIELKPCTGCTVSRSTST
jgi:hypothetical protein